MYDQLKTFLNVALVAGICALFLLGVVADLTNMTGGSILEWSAILGLAAASLWLIGGALSEHPGFMTRWYNVYAGVFGALLIVAMYRGWGFAAVERIHNVPKSVRDNPGAYRAHYRTYARYYGGK
jgi:hypothetical protein